MKKNRLIKIVGFVITATIFVNIYSYFELKHQAQEALKSYEVSVDQEIDLLGLMDSYGVPYSTSVDESFLNSISEELLSQEKLGSVLDLYNLYINKKWALNGVFKNEITIREFKTIQNYSIDFVRHKYGEKIKKELVYGCNAENMSVTVYDYVASLENPVVLYSCSANDLFYYFQVSLESLTPDKMIELILNWGTGLEFLENNVRGNLDTLLECNPDAQIYVMGLYVPSDNFFFQRIGTPFLKSINNRIEEACAEIENAIYVDVSCVSFGVLDGDFHPDSDGQKMIANLLKKSIASNMKSFEKNTSEHVNLTDYREYVDDNNVVDLEAEGLVDKVQSLSLPMDDYVECSVAIEKALEELECSEICYAQLSDIESEFLSYWENQDLYRNMKKGYEILLIERKVLTGITESDFCLYPDNARNDKLSLIAYY